MKKYTVKVSKMAEKDLENIISYIKYDLGEENIAHKYKALFKQHLRKLEYIAGSMPILDEKLTGYKNIRKINVRNYTIFYVADIEESKVYVVRVGHVSMNWEKYLENI